MTELAIKIHTLRKQGKTYPEICDELHCSKSTVCYHLGIGQKDKTRKRQFVNRSQQHPFIRRLESFFNPRCNRRSRRRVASSTANKLLKGKLERFNNHYWRKTKMYNIPTFTIEDVLNKVGSKPRCYLTGLPIDIQQPSTYSFDHIIPASRGGDNSLENLGVCTRLANSAKTDMTPDELINLCKLILQNNGYKVISSETTNRT